MKYIDIHAHLNFSDYDQDREQIIEKTLDNEMAVINIGTSLETSMEVVKLAEQYDGLYAAVGIHPTEAHKVENLDDTINKIKNLTTNTKVVCIGECGLDYFHIKGDTREYKDIQKLVFKRQVELALEVDLPLMIHCRDAYEGVINILSEYNNRTQDESDNLFGKKLRGNVHFFAGEISDIERLLDLNFTISFTGVVTFAPQYKELIAKVPIDKIHAETDSPFVSPEPFRGKRNEPLHTLEVIKKIAEVKNISFEEVSRQLRQNAQTLFNIAF